MFWPSIMVRLEQRRRWRWQLCIPLACSLFAPSRPTRPPANDNLQPRSHPLSLPLSLSLSIRPPPNFVPSAFHVNERRSLLERDAPALPAFLPAPPPSTWVMFRRHNYGNGRRRRRHAAQAFSTLLYCMSQRQSSLELRYFNGGKRDWRRHAWPLKRPPLI